MSVQRWKNRDWTWAREDAARPELYGVEPIARDKARAFVETHHYSASWPSCMEAFGLFRAEPFTPSLFKLPELVGVAVFGNPGNETVLKTYAGTGPRDGAELSRFVLLDAVEATGETLFLGDMFAQLRVMRPAWSVIVAYSDPVRRITRDGRVILPGHVGTIYQAHNGVYCGRGSPRTLRVLPDATTLSERSRQKIRNRERGHEYATRAICNALGIYPLKGESGASFLARVDAHEALRVVRHPGNHAYVWPLQRDAREGIARIQLGREREQGEGVSRYYRSALDARIKHYPKQIEQVEL